MIHNVIHVKFKITLVVILIFSFGLQAEEPTPCDYQLPLEAANWVFGESALVRFAGDVALAAHLGPNLNMPNGIASISDRNGNLLFFSDGMHIWSGNGILLQGTDNLKGNNFATQSALFVPQPGNDDMYYLFTVDMFIPPVFSEGIRYSTIERINGVWTVTNKNQLLHESNAQKITAVKHLDELSYWVITHGYDNSGDKFYAYLIDYSGLSSNPVTSTIGSVHRTIAGKPSSANNNTGYMKAASNGRMIALAIPDDGIIEVVDFNRANGQLTNVRSSGSGAFEYPFGLEFSPDNTKLYATTSPPGVSSTNRIYQFDLTQADIFTDPFVVEEFMGNSNVDDLFGALQLGIDGRVYVASYRKGVLGKPFMGVIYNPNRPGSECNYNHLGSDNNGLYLNGGQGLIGLPNYVTSFLEIPHFRWTNHCNTHITTFHLRNDANINQISWDFGDGSMASNEVLATHTYTEPGDYEVTVQEFYNNIPYTASRNLTIFPLPSVDISYGSDTLFILPNSSITLDAGEFDAYLWEPDGSTERYLDVDQEGLYIVTVTDTNCCKNSDTVYVAFSNVYLPTAFRPNSRVEGNNEFKIMGATSALENFRFLIFNRWGELVFETNDPGIGWDGSLMNGHEAPQGIYAWALYYESTESRYQPRQTINQRGVVTLMR